MKKILQTTLVAAMLLFSQSVFGQCTNGQSLTGTVNQSAFPIPITIGTADYYVPSGQTIIISGLVEVNPFNPVIGMPTPPQVTIVLNAGASIELAPSATLSMHNVNIEGCGALTNGIKIIDPSSKLEMMGCIIQDAIIGVHSVNGGDFDISNTNFHNNSTHMKIENSLNPHNGILHSNTFNNDGTGFINPLTSSNETDICIDIDSVSDITIGVSQAIHDPNMFDDANFGIDGNESTVEIINNFFGYFPLLTTPNTIMEAIKMKATGNSLTIVNTVDIGGQLPGYQNYFLNCIAIQCKNGMGVYIEGNYFDLDGNKAIEINKCGAIEILDNNIINTNGIYIKNIQKATVTISDNSIIAAPQGIRIFGGQHNNTNTKKANVVVNNNTISSTNQGISVMAVKPIIIGNQSPLIEDNTITLNVNGNNGIIVDHCQNAYIKANGIVNTLNSPAIPNAFFGTGIEIFNSPKTTAGENIITNFNKGISVHDDMTGTKIKCNTFNNCYDAVYFDGTSPSTLVIGCGSGEGAGNSFTGSVSDVTNNSPAVTVEWYYTFPTPANPTTFSVNVSPVPVTPSCSTCNTYPRIGSSEKPVTSFSIYPNPTTNYVNISLQIEDAMLSIYDLTGRLVLEKSLRTGTNTIDVNRLNAGIYQSHITSNGSTISTDKIVISR
jgi:hypothetical protein